VAIDPGTRVCPRCGSAAEDHEYCLTCGLNLFSCPELPTRAEWDAGGRKGLSGPAGTTSTSAPGRKIPGLAALLSLLIAGLGQLYAGAWGMSLVFLSTALAVGCGFGLVGELQDVSAAILVSVWSAIDAYGRTQRINQAGPPSWEENRTQIPIAAFIGAVALVLLVAAVASGILESTSPGPEDCTTNVFGEVVCE